jgi:hypothetical protein
LSWLTLWRKTNLKPGVYYGHVSIPPLKTFIKLSGSSAAITTITFNNTCQVNYHIDPIDYILFFFLLFSFFLTLFSPSTVSMIYHKCGKCFCYLLQWWLLRWKYLILVGIQDKNRSEGEKYFFLFCFFGITQQRSFLVKKNNILIDGCFVIFILQTFLWNAN